MSPFCQIFRSLEGTWKFHRVISSGGTLDGRAIFQNSSDNPNTLLYNESGLFLTATGAKLNFFKKYYYQYTATPIDSISVLFSDGRFFHMLHFEDCSTEAQGYHLCVQDTYKALYRFINPGMFELIYTVDGPKKKYTITTTFIREIVGQL